VENGVVYGAYTNQIFALNVVTGAVIWQKAGFSSFVAPLMNLKVVGDTLFVLVGLDNEGKTWLFALNKTDGSENWRHAFSGPSSQPLLETNGVVYVAINGNYSTQLNAMSINKGDVLWTYTSQQMVFNQLIVTQSQVIMWTMVEGGPSKLQALAIGDRSTAWVVGFQNMGLPVVYNGVIYLTDGKTISAYSTDGKLMHTYDAQGGGNFTVVIGA
jgi:outer membrane protein assembly factor BamB